MKQVRSNYKKRMLNLLGDPWTLKVVDGENCIYRDLGNYEITVSGGQIRSSLFHVYVWKKKPVFSIVERRINLRNGRDDIPSICEKLVAKYSTDCAVKLHAQ